MQIESVSEAIPESLTGRVKRRDHVGIRKNLLQGAPFIAWDGEGYTDDTGAHHYMLFGCRQDYVTVDNPGESLHFDDCFELLLDVASQYPGNHVIFGGDYDIIMMTKDMPFVIRDRLLKGQPVRYGGYRMQWYRRKFFQLADATRKIILYDVISFFQSSFVKACRQYLGNDDVLDQMEVMKAHRNLFTYGELDDDIVPYWRSELQKLEALMEVLRNLLQTVDIKPRGWYGPGAIASVILKDHSIQTHNGHAPSDVIDRAERAFYGGRFEQFYVGRMKSVHEYDIRSAYPYAISQLPSLHNASWHHVNKPGRVFNPYSLYCVSWDIFRKDLMRHGPFPWRNESGNVYFPPMGTKSWYWGIECQNLYSLPKDTWHVHEAWELQFDGPVQHPFAFVAQMYDDRARMKREGNPAQMALKLGMNSLYGKLAQSKGTRLEINTDTGERTWIKPRWHNIIWAGWITASCRARIWQAMQMAVNTRGAHVIAVETDALFTTAPINVPLTESLGDWDHLPIDELLYIQSGVYCAKEDGEWKFKSRGMEGAQAYDANKWLEIFSKLPHEEVELTLHLHRFGTILRSKTYARWYEQDRTITLPPKNSKRIHMPALCATCILSPDNSFVDSEHYLIVPQPLLTSDVVPSVPYKFPWRPDGASWETDMSVALEASPELEIMA